MELEDLHTKPIVKVTKKKDYRAFRIPVNANSQELQAWTQMAVEAGFVSKLQKPLQERKDTGKIRANIKGLSKWIREACIKDYIAHAWEREQKRAEAKRKLEEARKEAERQGISF